MSKLQIEHLREQLSEKFPQAHRPAPAPVQPLAREVSSLASAFADGRISEVVAEGPSSGLSLLFSELLSESRDLPLALIDGLNCFDPSSYGDGPCGQLLWIRCQRIPQAIQCADLLLRDGNLPLVVLDLHLACERELRQIPLSVWNRFKGQARDSGAALAVLTPRPLVPSPHQRVLAQGAFSLEHLELTSPQAKFVFDEGSQLKTKGLAR